MMKDEIVGVIPDLQFPGHIDKSLEFVLDTFSDHKVTKYHCVGDLIDYHYIGRWQNEPDALNSEQEWFQVMKELESWVKAFPKMTLNIGNHDERPELAAASMGMSPKIFIRPLNEIYNLPDTWRWSWRWDINGVIYEHGVGSTGMYAPKNTAIKLGASYVQGHTHSYAGVFDVPQARRRLAAMNVGCLMDEDKYNARYGKKVFKVPMSLGCGIVYDEVEMKFVPMR
jgi:hypothetical protein